MCNVSDHDKSLRFREDSAECDRIVVVRRVARKCPVRIDNTLSNKHSMHMKRSSDNSDTIQSCCVNRGISQAKTIVHTSVRNRWMPFLCEILYIKAGNSQHNTEIGQRCYDVHELYGLWVV